MSVVYQIPRNSLAWLLAAMFAGVAPHLLRLPWWIGLLCLICGGWRILVYRGRTGLPGRWVRCLIVLAGVAAVLGHYGTFMGAEAGSALLVIGFAFKLLEMRERRDAFVVVILAYFVVATQFFFSQTMASAAYMLVVILMVTAALVGLCQSPLRLQPRRTARLALVLVGQSVPLMLVLFIFVPRVAPLWSLDLKGGSGSTGISDEVTPGDIASLGRDPALAFRVEFDGPVPPTAELYWRGLVLSNFDGRTWRVVPDDSRPVAWSRERLPRWIDEVEYLGRQVDYRVILEPSRQRWLFSLPVARSSAADVGLTGDYHLLRRDPVAQTYAYSVRSTLDYRLAERLDPGVRELNLQLPAGGNPRSRELAASWRALYPADTDLIAALLRWFNQEAFYYTLKPPRLTGDTIDEFLYETRRGFCSHYAGAFVFLMRSAGIPARMVAGYQGGEYNQLGNYVLVHQFDAHAWAEVWLPGRGWVRVDPTASVAPERVERGLEAALGDEESFLEGRLFAPARYRTIAWISDLRLGWDYLQYSWNRLVLGYDTELQARLLQRWLGDLNLTKWALVLLFAVFLVLACLGGLLYRRRALPPEPEALRLYRRFCRRLQRYDLERARGETPGDFARRVALRNPELEAQVARATALYERLSYAPDPDPETLAELRRLARRGPARPAAGTR